MTQGVMDKAEKALASAKILLDAGDTDGATNRAYYAMFDAGDGPAVFVVLIVGAIVCAGALYVEFTFSPPYWVHAVLWVPLIVILSLTFLRLSKSTLLVLQYKHKAGEGRRI